MRGIEPWAKVNWAPCRLMPTFQTSDLLHQNFSAGSNANVKDWAICWHYIPLSQSNHPQMSTNSHRDLGFFKNRFYPTILSVHQQINTDRSWRRSKRWQPWVWSKQASNFLPTLTHYWNSASAHTTLYQSPGKIWGKSKTKKNKEGPE